MVYVNILMMSDIVCSICNSSLQIATVHLIPVRRISAVQITTVSVCAHATPYVTNTANKTV